MFFRPWTDDDFESTEFVSESARELAQGDTIDSSIFEDKHFLFFEGGW